MKLREEIHRSIDALDSQSLVVVHEQLQLLLKSRSDQPTSLPASSLEEVLVLTRCDPGDWSADVIAERSDRL
ncbi:MAG: hypothetical protein HYV26_03720 [Candidatus Hydrogenedentes bacterium]|nr:hypothetical protein [Candidatus Hydrogenedentota bacterium]